MRILLFLLAPLVDIYLLVLATQHVGPWPVIGFVLVSAVAGGWLARREGRRLLNGLRDARDAGRAPTEGLLSAGLVALAGALMILPGPMSTLGGIALLLPPVRRVLSALARRWFEKRVLAVSPIAGLESEVGPSGGGPRGPVIDVESTETPVDPRR